MYVGELGRCYPYLGAGLIDRYINSYGTRSKLLLGDAQQLTDLGQHFGHGLYAREVDYLRKHEWALTPDDVLDRRTRIGLRTTKPERDALGAWLAAH